MPQYQDKQIIPGNVGFARINGLDLNWTSASEVNRTHTFGDFVIDADNAEPVRLPGRPEYDQLTLTTPWTKRAIREVRNWLRTDNAKDGEVGVTIEVAEIFYTFTKCSVSQSPVSPAVDQNTDETSANFLTMVLEVTEFSDVEIKEGSITRNLQRKFGFNDFDSDNPDPN